MDRVNKCQEIYGLLDGTLSRSLWSVGWNTVKKFMICWMEHYQEVYNLLDGTLSRWVWSVGWNTVTMCMICWMEHCQEVYDLLDGTLSRSLWCVGWSCCIEHCLYLHHYNNDELYTSPPRGSSWYRCSGSPGWSLADSCWTPLASGEKQIYNNVWLCNLKKSCI